MKNWLIDFFGVGTEPEFALFTPAHLMPVLAMLGLIYFIYRRRDFLRTWKREEALRYVLAFALLLADMSYYWRLAGAPWLSPGPSEALPIGVCGWSAILCCFMLTGKKQGFFDIVYFWIFSGSLFALITPTPLTFTGPTRFRYYQFWCDHCLSYVAVFYMIFVHGMRPTIKSAVKSYCALLCMALIAYTVNTMIPGANYLYLARPEAAPSVLDILPPSFALRTAIIVGVITLMFALAYYPWYRRDKKAAPIPESTQEGEAA